ncbi:MAG: flagellar type III secretion system pore protein FliP [bacterium]
MRETMLCRAFSQFVRTAAFWAALSAPVFAQGGLSIPRINISFGESGGPADLALTLKILIVLTILSLAPTILIMTTSFIRIIIVFSFLRSALGLQQMPPNQLLIGFALLLTFYIMKPSWMQMYQEGLSPYLAGKLDQKQALTQGLKPLRKFMLKQTRKKELLLFYEVGNMKVPPKKEDVPFDTLLSAFVLSELKTSFQMGFALFIPFVVIDLVIASVLTSMGMLMLPPVMISLPFKLMMFVLVDGWDLLVKSLLTSFR